MIDSRKLAAVTPRAHRATFAAALAIFLAVVLWMVGPYLLSLFLGGTAAMLCGPLQLRLRRSMGPRAAAAAVTGFVLLLIIAPLAGFSVLAVRQGIELGREMSELREFSPRALSSELSRSELVRNVIGDQAVVRDKVKSAIHSAGQFTSAAIVRLGKAVPEFLLQLCLALVAFFFFLLDGKRFMDWLLGLDVLDRDVQTRLVESFRDTAASSVLAGLAAASAQAALISIGYLALGIPGSFLAGGLTFVFAWIPVLGTLPASLAGTMYLYIQGDWVKMGFMIALALFSGLADNLIRPLVLKGRADMHPLVGLIAIIGGIQLFGILGVFIGPIMAAMLLALLRIWPAGL